MAMVLKTATIPTTKNSCSKHEESIKSIANVKHPVANRVLQTRPIFLEMGLSSISLKDFFEEYFSLSFVMALSARIILFPYTKKIKEITCIDIT